ncbi:substrate-binding domain-containing protein [Lachnospiraceae bacterium MD308]|nr:substrate-binding domain-containing protein [Lachnospiraceae bacterium MD308]MCI8579561.1 LacI family transcriptional regulator [Dorea sp.]
MGQKKNVTFNDIAKYTHFSKTTISRYFNNPDSLTLENQEIIAKALADLDYKENKVARILANGKTEFIGIIIPNLSLHYYSEMLNKILSTYEQFGYKFLVFIGNENGETERRYIKELLAYKIEGLIILSHTIPSKELSDLNLPIVTIEREDKYVCSVNTDNYMGGYQATSLLARLNCDILIHINSPTDEAIPAYGRVRGFLDLCREKRIPHEIILKEIGSTYESIQGHLKTILDDLEQKYAGKKKGVFLSNDSQANVFLNLLIRKYGFLPDDYLIIGFDNSPVSREAIIPISTIGQQIDKIAYEAVSMLVGQMNERKKRRPAPPKEPVHKVITPILIRRDTTEKM